MFKNIFFYLTNKLNNSPLIKNTLVVTIGTGIAQAFPMIAYPVLARIFSPAEFGLLAIITSLVPIIAIISSGAYEGGILLSKSKKSSINLAAYIFIRSLIFLFCFFVILVIFNNLIIDILNEPNLNYWLLTVPFISFGAIIYNISNEWFIKYKYFPILSLNKALYTISNVSFKLFFGLVAFMKSGGLILGDILGKIFIVFFIFIRFLNLEKNILGKITKEEIKESPKEIPDFPKYAMPDQIISNLAGSIHIFFISAFFGSTQLGFVAIVSSILYVPITIFSSAIKDVFKQRAIEDIENSGNCRPLYIKLLIPVSLISFIGFGFLYFLLPTFFRYFLGEEWIQAGEYSQIMTPLFCFSFISMAFKDIFVVVKKMHIALIWQIFFIIILTIALIIGTSIYENMKITLYLMTYSCSFSYLIYILLSYYFAKK